MNLMYAKTGIELNALWPELLSLQDLSVLWKRSMESFVLMMESTLETVGFDSRLSCTKKQTVIH